MRKRKMAYLRPAAAPNQHDEITNKIFSGTSYHLTSSYLTYLEALSTTWFNRSNTAYKFEVAWSVIYTFSQ